MDIQILQIVFSVAILIMSVVIHEVSHGYAALMLGDSTAKYQDRLTLNPLKHLDPIGSVIVPIVGFVTAGFIVGWAKPVPYNPYNLRNQRWGELWVAIAGPLSNISVAVVFGLIARFGAGSISATFVGFSLWVMFVNFGLAIFNLIPIPPLDGSKVLFSFLPSRFREFRVHMERYAMLLILLLILVPVFGNLISWIVIKASLLTSGLSVQSLIQYLSF